MSSRVNKVHRSKNEFGTKSGRDRTDSTGIFRVKKQTRFPSKTDAPSTMISVAFAGLLLTLSVWWAERTRF